MAMTEHDVVERAPTRPPGRSAEDGARRPGSEVLAAAADRFRRVDVRNTWQVAAGAVLMPLGVVVILLGWYGSAHTPYVQQQIPYLVSGSFVGLGLMVLGGLLFWAHWLYRIYDQADLHHAERVAREERLFQDLLEAVLTLGSERGQGRPSPNGRSRAVGGPAGADGADLVATASGTNVHRPDCPVVSRHSEGLRPLSAEEAGERQPCRICRPSLPA